MAFSNRISQTAMIGFSVFWIAAATVGDMAWAQVGPQMPEKRPAPENSVGKAITKFLKTKKTNTDEDETEVGPAPASGNPSNMGAGKPPVMPPTTGPAHEPLLTQPPLTNAKIETPQVDADNPPILSHPKLDDPANPLGFADSENKLKHLMTLVDAKRFTEAKPGLLQLRQWLIDLTEAHIGLYKTLNQVPTAKGQAELEKELALQFAQLRDRTMVELSKVYIAEKDYQKAVKDLAEVVKSQPRSRLGLYSYGLLQEIGFTEKLQLAQ